MLYLFLQAADKPDFISLGAQAITLLTPLMTVIVLWAVKMGWNKVPASIVIFAAPVLGVLLNWAVSYVSGVQADSVLLAALLGAVGTWLREIVTTIQVKGFGGGVTITKGMI